MIGRNKDVTKLGMFESLDMKIGNLISRNKEKINRNLDKYKHIYYVIFVLLLIGYSILKSSYFWGFGTLFGSGILLYLLKMFKAIKGKDKIKIGQNYDVRKRYAGANIFGKNRSSCIIEVTDIDIIDVKKNVIVVPRQFFERIMNSEISRTMVVTSDKITKIPIIDEKNKIDVLNPVLKEEQKMTALKENIEFINWVKRPDNTNRYEINIHYRRNDEYGDNSVHIPLKSIIDEGLINLK